MWSYVKRILLALLAAACIYGVFFVDIAGKSVASHIGDVWRSPLMQKKLQLVKSDLQARIDRHTASLRDGGPRAGDRPHGDLSQADRESLSTLIDKVKE